MTDQLRRAGARRPRPTGTSPRTRLGALAVALLALLLAAGTVRMLEPPGAAPATAADGEFSADRAVAFLGGIAAGPRPAGSVGSAAVRDRLVAQLRALGLQPELQTRVASRAPDGGLPTVGSVTNVHARIAGTHPTGRVVLVAHHDSVPTGPGAADNGANVATILEIARALCAGPAPRNDVDLLFTDAEELGLLGAQAFVNSGAAGDPARVVVVNLEARGVRGPAVTFQTVGPGAAPGVRAAGAVTTSFATAVYDLLPNDTDLSVFDRAGMRGLNIAFFDGLAHYHTPHDDLAHLDPASVQAMGEAGLRAARGLAATDLAAAPYPPATWFSLFGVVVAYPAWIDVLVAALGVAGFVVLLATGRRHGLQRRGVGRAVATGLAAWPAVLLIGGGGWWLLSLVRPETGLGGSALYRPGPYVAVEAVVLLAAVVVWYRWARRRATPDEVAVGVLGWLLLLTVALLVLLPSGAYLFGWPALVGVAALAAVLPRSGPDAPLRAAARCVAAVPAVALQLPVVLLLVPALGLALAAVALLLGGLLLATLAIALDPLPRRPVLAVVTVGLLGTAAVGGGVATATDTYDAAHPRAVSLAYALDDGRADWISLGGPDQPVVGRYLTGGPIELGERIPSLGGVLLTSGPAPRTATAVGADTELLERVALADGGQQVRIRVQAPAAAYLVEIFAGAGAPEVLGAAVDGVEVPAGAPGAGPWAMGYVAPPAVGVELTLRLARPGPVPLRIVAISPGLPPDVGAPVLPPDVSWTPWPALPAETYAVRAVTV